jgi:hypothetical protein
MAKNQSVMSMFIPPRDHLMLSVQGAFCPGSRASLEKELRAVGRNCPEGSAAGSRTGRAPKREHINPCPWSEGEGRRIFAD